MSNTLSDNIVDIKDLSIAYTDRRRTISVYKNFSISIKENETVTIVGQSGTGKSTLANFLIGILPSSARLASGEYVLDKQLIFKNQKFASINKVRGSKIAFIFQDAQESLNPIKTIYAQFEELLLYHKICAKTEVRKLAQTKLDQLLMDNSDKVLSAYPFELSGGMCQRVCIAMCLCLEPKLLIADEPTSALDVLSAEEVLNNLNSLNDISKLIITHDISVAAKCSDRIVVLKDGEICEQGAVQTILSHPQKTYTKELIESYKNISRLSCQPLAIKNSILDISGIEKSYANHNVLKGVDLTIYQGEIIGLIGESGCGKSTLSRCIMGLEHGATGQVWFEGQDLLRLKGKKRRKLSTQIQMIFQNSRAVLNPRYKVIDLVTEPLKYNRMYDTKKRIEMAKDILSMVDIGVEHYHAKPGELSTGQCQRVAIARALIVKPKILICDEAVSSLDVTIQLQILRLLLNLKQAFNLTVLMISHDIRLVKNFCNRIAIMKDGQILDLREGGSDFANAQNPYVKRLNNLVYEIE